MAGPGYIYGGPPPDPMGLEAPLPWPPPEWNDAPPLVEPLTPPVQLATPLPGDLLGMAAAAPLPAPDPAPGLFPAPSLGHPQLMDGYVGEQPPPEGPLPDPFQTDAISGGQTPAPLPYVPVDDTLAAPDQGPSDAEFADAEAARQSALSPEQFATEVAEREAGRTAAVQAREDAETLRNDQDAADNLRARRRADAKAAQELADINADAKALADRDVDPDRYMANHPLAAIAGVISAMISGYLNPGGPNSGISMMKEMIDRDVRAQEADLAKDQNLLQGRRSAVAELYSQNGDAFRSAETVRLAAWQSLDKKLAVEGAKYDPRGTVAARIAAARFQVRGEQAKAAAALEKQTYDRHQDTAKAELEQRKFDETVRARRATAGQAAAAASATDRRWMAENHMVPDPKSPTGYSPDPTWKPEQNPKAAKEAADAEKARIEADQAARGDLIVGSDGTAIGKPRFGPLGAKEAADQGVAYEKFRSTAARLRDVIKDNSQYGGWGSGRWPTEAQTQATSLRQELANQLAKLRDPKSVNRESEVAAAMTQLPDMDTLTTSKNPGVTYRTITKTADDAYDIYLGANVESFDPAKSPTRRYQAADKLLESGGKGVDSREETAAAAAAPVWRGLSPAAREASIAQRAAEITKLGRRDGGMDEAQYASKLQALDAQRASDDLTPGEYSLLRASLDAARSEQPKSVDHEEVPYGRGGHR